MDELLFVDNKLNALRNAIHKNAINKGFYEINDEQPIINIPERLMLIVSELGEALEAYRKNHYSNYMDYFDSEGVITGRFNKYAFESYIKDSFEDELADSIIRILDLCGHLNIDIQQHIELKMKYNETRPYKHGKKC